MRRTLNRIVKTTCESFKACFKNMMRIFSCQSNMKRHTCGIRKTSKEMRHHFHGKIANIFREKLAENTRYGRPERSRAISAFASSMGRIRSHAYRSIPLASPNAFRKASPKTIPRLPPYDVHQYPNPLCGNCNIHFSVPSQLFEHVIEKSNTSGNIIFS